MGFRMIRTFLLAVTMLTSACGHMQSIDKNLYDSYLTKSFMKPKEACFKATIRALSDANMAVEKSDLQTGMIYASKAPFEERVYISGNGRRATGRTITDSHRFTLQIEGQGNNCIVRTVKYEFWHDNEKLPSINTDYAQPKVWQPFFESINDALERGT